MNQKQWKLTQHEFLKLINRYAYETKENNYTRISEKDYKEWHSNILKYVEVKN